MSSAPDIRREIEAAPDPKAREAQIKAFVEDPEVEVIVCSLTAAGVGMAQHFQCFLGQRDIACREQAPPALRIFQRQRRDAASGRQAQAETVGVDLRTCQLWRCR